VEPHSYHKRRAYTVYICGGQAGHGGYDQALGSPSDKHSLVPGQLDIDQYVTFTKNYL
jgi:hypothetical protein